MSIVSLLERVEELQTARRISNDKLFASAIELLKGKALLWYRLNVDRCRSCEDFTSLLKMHFFPPD